MSLSFLLCISAFSFAPLAYASDCGQSLDGAPQDLESEISPDDRAVRWLKDLLGAEIKWPTQDAHAAVTRLLAGSRESPVSEGAVNGNADLQVHREKLAELMQEVSDSVAVGRALQEELDRREGTAQRRGETREDVELELYVRMNFGEILPGTFSARLHNISYLIKFPRRFWMALTPTTWWQLGEVLPRLRRHDRTANSPAGDLTYDEAQEFVDELNRWARTNDPRLRRVVPDHQPTWRYSLPDAWEWIYVASHLAANSSGVEAWQQDSRLNELTLGGFKSMTQATRFFRDGGDSLNWEVGELDPMMILGSKFHDLGGNFHTWLRLNLWAPIDLDSLPKRAAPKKRLTIQTPGNIPKELNWFIEKVLKQPPQSKGTSSQVWRIDSWGAPHLSFHNVDSTRKYPARGIRLIAFEADSETDARLDSTTPIDEAATIARLGADFLTHRILDSAKSTNARASSRLNHRTHMLLIANAALKDWKQGQRNSELEKAFQSDNELMKVLQHPALDLPRLALELEVQLEGRDLTP